MTVVIGIDPGLSGAIAVVDTTGRLLHVADMPVVDHQVSAPLLNDQLDAWHSDGIACVVIEEVAAMPGQGVTSTFRFGQAHGIALGVATARWRVERPRPAVWKRAAGLTADKELSRRRAIERWPEHAALFARKRDDGRAEAALLAAWWLDRQVTP